MKGQTVLAARVAAVIAALVSSTAIAHADPVTVTATATATAVATPTTVTVTVTASPTTTSSSTTPTTTTTTAAAPLLVPAGSEYAAMGDSYSSGEGANQNPGTAPDPNAITGNCRRSINAAQVLMSAKYGWNLLNLACGGSTTANVLNTFGWEQPQINLVTANTKLVTMTIGGNDVQLLQLLVNCVVSQSYGDCVTSNPQAMAWINQTDTATATLQTKIQNVVTAIIQKAPTAKVRMAGYPSIIAPPGQPLGTCSAWLSAGEQSMFELRLSAVNNAIQAGTRAVAAQYPGRDIQYLDPRAVGSPFAPTDNGCSTSPTRYLNGATGDSTSWHPNNTGQADYATLYQGAS